MIIGVFCIEYPPRIVGGLGTYAENIYPEMVKQGHDVSVFTLNDGTLKTRERLNDVDVNRPIGTEKVDILSTFFAGDVRNWGIGMIFFNSVLTYNILSATKFINKLIKKEGKEFDIICAHDWLSAIAGKIVKQETDLPFVFHLHSTEWGRALDGGSETIIHIEKKTAKIADKVITVSYPMQEDLVKHGFDPDKIEVCWNGIDIDKYNQSTLESSEITSLRDNYGISPEEKMILFIGRLTGVKGIMSLVRAMPSVIEKNPNIKLVILGKGELERSISDLIDVLHMKDKIKTKFEFVPEKERILHYGACDLFAAPSTYEPFGIVALEAMAMKKLVVVGANGVSGFRDFVTPKKTGFHVNGNDSKDIAWGIKAALEDINEMKKMGERGRRQVEKYFSWPSVAKYTTDIYEKVLSNRKP